jgi:hypothetical protein
MKRQTLLSIFSVALLAMGCGDDTTSSGSDKVDSDEQEMTLDPDGDGVAEGQQAGDLASMSFELSEPLPEIAGSQVGDGVHRAFDATEDAALADVTDALDLTVSSPRSGVSLSLTADGTLVPAPPSGPGEWSVTLSDDRMDFTIEWYNETTSGARIEPGRSYDVVYSVGSNCCVARVTDQTLEFSLDG